MRGGRGASREAGGPVGGGGTQAACTCVARLKAWGPRARAEAHVEHVAHGRDAGGVQAQRLVEGRRALPSRGEGMRCGRERCKPEGGRAWGAWWRHTRGMHRDGPTQGLGAKGTRGAHVEHDAHGRDAGGVEAQRLVEGRRALPSRRGGHAMPGAERCEPRRQEGLWVVAARQERMPGTRTGSRLGGQGHARSARRTWSAWSVTLEVSKLSGWLKADAPCRVEQEAAFRGQVDVRGAAAG